MLSNGGWAMGQHGRDRLVASQVAIAKVVNCVSIEMAMMNRLVALIQAVIVMA